MKINFDYKTINKDYENGDVLVIRPDYTLDLSYVMFIKTEERDDYLFDLEKGTLTSVSDFSLSFEEIYGDNYEILETIKFNDLIISRR